MQTDNAERARQARTWLRAAIIEPCAEGHHIVQHAPVYLASGEYVGEAHAVIQGMSAIILDLIQRLGEHMPEVPRIGPATRVIRLEESGGDE